MTSMAVTDDAMRDARASDVARGPETLSRAAASSNCQGSGLWIWGSVEAWYFLQDLRVCGVGLRVEDGGALPYI